MAATASPQLVAVGDQNQIPMLHKNNTYANLIKQPAASPPNSIKLKPISFVQGEPSVTFDSTDIEAYIQEENLQYALILKFSKGYPDIHELRKLFPQQFQIKGECKIGLIHHRHFLVRFSLVEDFVNIYSRIVESVIIKENGIGQQYTFRIQRWTTKFNPKEETPIALAWISFPGLPCQMFARQAIYSLASAVGRPLHVDKATADKTRPSTARVKVEVNLLSNLPDRVRMCFKDVITGEISVQWQTINYDRLPKYCATCKKQGHGNEDCRANNQGDLRQKLNDQRKNVDVAGKEENGKEMIAGKAPDFTKARKSPAATELTTMGQLGFSNKLGEKCDAEDVFRQAGTTGNHVSTMKEQRSLIHTTNVFQVLQKDIEDDDDEVTANHANAVTKTSLLPHAREKVNDNCDKHGESPSVLNATAQWATPSQQIVETRNKHDMMEEALGNKILGKEQFHMMYNAKACAHGPTKHEMETTSCQRIVESNKQLDLQSDTKEKESGDHRRINNENQHMSMAKDKSMNKGAGTTIGPVLLHTKTNNMRGPCASTIASSNGTGTQNVKVGVVDVMPSPNAQAAAIEAPAFVTSQCARSFYFPPEYDPFADEYWCRRLQKDRQSAAQQAVQPVKEKPKRQEKAPMELTRKQQHGLQGQGQMLGR